MKGVFTRGTFALLLSFVITACPLPYEFSGEGAGDLGPADPSSPTITAPVQVSYRQTAGSNGSIAHQGSAETVSDTTISLSTETEDATIFFSIDGSSPNPGSGATSTYSGSIDLSIANPTQDNASRILRIRAVAIARNMRPSPETDVTVTVRYFGSDRPIVELLPGTFFVSGDTSTANPAAVFVRASSPELSGADGLQFRLRVGSAPSTGEVREADELEAEPTGSGNSVDFTILSGLPLGSSQSVYVRQKGTETLWSDAGRLDFRIDDRSWLGGRITPIDSSDTALRQAIQTANVTPNAFVDLRAFSSFTVSSQLLVDGSMTIVGASTILRGSGSNRILYVDTGAELTLDDLIIENGVDRGQTGGGGAGLQRQSGGGGGGGTGGGMVILGADVSISNSVFRANSALGGAGGVGSVFGDLADAIGGAGGGNSDGQFGGAGGAPGADGLPGGDFGGGGAGGSSFSAGGAGGAGGFGGGGGGGGARSGSGSGLRGGFGGPYGGSGSQGGSSGAAGGGGGAGLGGAISLLSGSLTLFNVEFQNNVATGGTGGPSYASAPGENGEGRGGAIFRLADTTFAEEGPGAIYSGNSSSTGGSGDNVFTH